MQQALGDFDPAGQAPGERFGPVAGPVGKPQVVEQCFDPAAQGGPRKAVKITLRHQVFANGQFAVEAGRLKCHADQRANARRLFGNVNPQKLEPSPAGPARASPGSRNSVVLPPPLGPRRPKISPAATSKPTSCRACRLPYQCESP